MSFLVQNKHIYTLQDIASEIKDVLDTQFERSFWVKTEINKLNHYTYSGHAYPELVDKHNGKIVAQMRSLIWKNDFDRINLNFLRTVKEPLKDGIKVLMLCTITFDAVYGLSLRIHDIDPSFSLGDLELEKKQSIEKLQAEGLFDKNKSIPIPLLPKRIAIISVETSKGFVDFTQVIQGNEWGYDFFTMLFPAILQGDSAIKDIQYQLNRIKKVKKHFDVVAIIRGGGGDVGLSCYNDYSLAKAITEFPLPVLSGIGHATNETVVEMVTCKNAITPTKLAEFLIQQFHNFSVPVLDAQKFVKQYSQALFSTLNQSISQNSRVINMLVSTAIAQNQKLLSQSAHQLNSVTMSHINEQLMGLNGDVQSFQYLANAFLKAQKSQIHSFSPVLKKSAEKVVFDLKVQIARDSGERFTDSVEEHLKNHQNILQQSEQLVKMADPVNILKRGFSITRINGHSVNHVDQLSLGDTIETEFYQGKTKSTINTINLKKEDE
jgi:exodeoxyribonuclease VII large subunit